MSLLPPQFIGWSTQLAQGVAARLIEAGRREAGQAGLPLDLGSHRVIVPSSFATRLIQEQLALQCPEGVLLPQIETPERFLNWGDSHAEVASRESCLLAWVEVLTSPDFDRGDFPDLFPSDSTALFSFDEARKFAEQLMEIRDQLGGSAKVHDFASVARSLGESSGRWHDLARLEAAYLSVLTRQGKKDHNKVRADLATGDGLPEGVRHVWLAGLLDPQPLLLEALERRQEAFDIHVVVGADPEPEWFDRWGRPIAERWAQRSQPWKTFPEAVHLVRDPEHGLEKLAELLDRRAPDHGVVSIAPCERERFPGLLSDRLRALGAEAVNPLGRLHADHAIHHSAGALLDLLENRSFAHLRRALLHPALARNLPRHPTGFTTLNTLLDALSQLKPPQALPALLAHVEGLADPGEGDARARHAWKQVDSLKPLLREISAQLDRLDGLDARVLGGEILKLAQDSSAPKDVLAQEYAQEVSEALEETLASLLGGRSGGLELPATRWVRLALSLAGEKRFRQSLAKKPVNLPGWMEAPWDPVPHLIVFGLTDDLIPSATHAHAFLPAKLRSQLGLTTPEQHFANAAFTLERLRQSRESLDGDRSRGRLDIIVPRLDSNGDGLRPSRLLFQCADDELVRRVRHLFEGEIATEEQPYWRIPQNLKLAPAAQPKQAQAVRRRISATSFKDYLANPADFWLKHALGMRETSHDDLELDRAGFGTLLHAALEAFGRDVSMRGCDDEAKIARRLSECLDEHFHAAFGQEHEPGLAFQRETARERLLSFAPLQARLVREGWRTVEVEGRLPALNIQGMEVGGRFDRLDYNAASKTWRVYDYKSFDKVESPEDRHVTKHRKGNRENPDFEYVVTTVKEDAKGKKTPKIDRYRWDDLQLPVYYRNLTEAHPRVHGERLEVGYIILPSDGEAVAEIWPDYAAKMAEHATQAIDTAVRKILEENPENFTPVASGVKYPVLEAFSRRRAADYMDLTLLGTVRQEEDPAR